MILLSKYIGAANEAKERAKRIKEDANRLDDSLMMFRGCNVEILDINYTGERYKTDISETLKGTIQQIEWCYLKNNTPYCRLVNLTAPIKLAYVKIVAVPE